MRILRIGHSPDPDDAFMFYGFASGQVGIPGCDVEHVLHDIQTLNRLAAGDDPPEVTALSVHAWFDLADRYEPLEVGTSVGRRYGPRVVSREPRDLASLAGARIALPGAQTTAALVARGLLPPFEAMQMDFTEIMDAVSAGRVDAGVIIHEGQLTYGDRGLFLVADLGELFAKRHGGLPLPLGVNCVRRDLPADLKVAIAAAYRRSVEIALEQREEAVRYSLGFARGLDPALADRFVGMYVNEDSLAFPEDVRAALRVLRSGYWTRGGSASERSRPMTREEVIETCLRSECFAAEVAYAEAAGYPVSRKVRLYKELDGQKVRVVFPVEISRLEEGAVVAITCLFDRKRNVNTYAHTICAGPGVNVTLKAVHSPLGRATPQPGEAGAKAVLHFVEWKKASWGRFLNQELEDGNEAASVAWLRSFWKALDRMFGGGVLSNCPADHHWEGR